MFFLLGGAGRLGHNWCSSGAIPGSGWEPYVVPGIKVGAGEGQQAC